jgi:hypothetical protein
LRMLLFARKIAAGAAALLPSNRAPIMDHVRGEPQMLLIKPELSASEIESKIAEELSKLPIEGFANFHVCMARRDLCGANWDVAVSDNEVPRGFAAGLACVVPNLQKQYDIDWQGT